jgi:antitoxin component YwqK of YwqJK toxin-antitoxin module
MFLSTRMGNYFANRKRVVNGQRVVKQRGSSKRIEFYEESKLVKVQTFDSNGKLKVERIMDRSKEAGTIQSYRTYHPSGKVEVEVTWDEYGTPKFNESPVEV